MKNKLVGPVLVSMCENHHEQLANQIDAVCGDCDDCLDWTREWFDLQSDDPEIQCIQIMLEAMERRHLSGRQIERIAKYFESKATQLIEYEKEMANTVVVQPT